MDCPELWSFSRWQLQNKAEFILPHAELGLCGKWSLQRFSILVFLETYGQGWGFSHSDLFLFWDLPSDFDVINKLGLKYKLYILAWLSSLRKKTAIISLILCWSKEVTLQCIASTYFITSSTVNNNRDEKQQS